MARKTATVIVSAEGRDKGKHYLLTEMPASQAEKWAMRVLMALTRAGADIPEGVLQMGFAGVAMLGMRAFGGIPMDEAAQLMDEMMECVKFIPDPARPDVIRQLFEDDIDEVETRLMLRGEVLALHTNFSVRDILSRLRTALASTTDDTSTTSTSPAPSAPSSQPA